MRLGIKPFMPLASIAWVAGGMVLFASLGLYALSRFTLSAKAATSIILITAGVVVGFTAFLWVEMFTAKRVEPWDLIDPARDGPPTNQ
jgi:hypothetical protein